VVAVGSAVTLDDDYVDRLHDLAEHVPAGPWHAHRSDYDGALILFNDDEPLAHIYGGIDVAKWICETSPSILFGGAP
jgi:hypothetical protein